MDKTVIFAYIEEPPFARTKADGTPAGCDVEIALSILDKISIRDVETKSVTFPDLIPGVVNKEWTLNTPMFITPERSQSVQFSHPVWVLSDGFIVREDMTPTLNSYVAIAQNEDIKLGVVRGQVQHQRALDAGIPQGRTQIFEKQEDVVLALLDKQVDAYVATSTGHRAYLEEINKPQLKVIDIRDESIAPSFGAYSFSKSDTALISAFNEALVGYVASSEYHVLMSAYGFSDTDIELVRSQY